MPSSSAFEIHSGITMQGQLSLAKDVLVTGKFEGDLKTLGCLTVAAGGVVTGSMEAAALVLEPGHQAQGKIKIGVPVRLPFEPADRKTKTPPAKWPASLKKLKEMALGRK